MFGLRYNIYVVAKINDYVNEVVDVVKYSYICVHTWYTQHGICKEAKPFRNNLHLIKEGNFLICIF